MSPQSRTRLEKTGCKRIEAASVAVRRTPTDASVVPAATGHGKRKQRKDRTRDAPVMRKSNRHSSSRYPK